MEPSQIVCHFCEEPISGEVIHPCQCEKYYHPSCLDHLIIMGKTPLSVNKCIECQCSYQTRYKNNYDFYIYLLFAFQSRYYYYLYSLFGLVWAVIGVIYQGVSEFLFGLSIGSQVYAILLWSLISLAFLFYRLVGYRVPLLITLSNLALLIINLNYPNSWLNCSVLAITSACLVKVKKYLFVLSSNFPYLIVKNYESEIEIVSV